jgi:hypothetical protein
MSWWTVRLRVRARSAFQAACPGSYQSVSMESSGLLSTSMLCNRGRRPLPPPYGSGAGHIPLQ